MMCNSFFSLPKSIFLQSNYIYFLCWMFYGVDRCCTWIYFISKFTLQSSWFKTRSIPPAMPCVLFDRSYLNPVPSAVSSRGPTPESFMRPRPRKQRWKHSHLKMTALQRRTEIRCDTNSESVGATSNSSLAKTLGLINNNIFHASSANTVFPLPFWDTTLASSVFKLSSLLSKTLEVVVFSWNKLICETLCYVLRLVMLLSLR